MRYPEESRSMGDVEEAFPNLVELLRARADEKPEQTAYLFLGDGETESGQLSFAGLDRRARAIAARLQTMDMTGERALLLYPPGLEYIEAFFGCLYAGVIAVPAYPPTRQHLPRLQAVMRDAAPAVIMTTAELAARFGDEFVEFVGCAPRTGSGVDTQDRPCHWLATDAAGNNEAESWNPPALTSESLAFLQYTSGSTGDPKGVMVSHGNLLANQEAIRQSFGHTERSTVVGWLPLYHDMGLIGNILQPLYVGSTAVLMPPMAFLEKPVRWLKAVSKYRAATSGGPNFAYDLCVRKVTAEQKRDLDLSAWALAFNGSEPVRAATLERFSEAFAECGFRRESFYPCYGLAEATLFVTGNRLETRGLKLEGGTPEIRIGEVSRLQSQAPSLVSCGFSADRHIVQIIDPTTGTPCRSGREGEIWISGPSVAQGYWNRAEESENTFMARLEALDHRLQTSGIRPMASGLKPEASFLRTGDLGLLDDGRLYVTGRIKDLIIIRGRNYYPQDIEHALTDNADALRPGGCAAFSVSGEDEEKLIVVAELIREAMRHADYEAIFASMRSTLAEACELTATELVLVQPGGVPKTSSGKLRRQTCKEAYLGDTLPVLARSGDARGGHTPVAWLDSQATSGRVRDVREYKGTPQGNTVELGRHTGMDSCRTILAGTLRVNANPLQADLCRYPVDRDVTPQVVPSIWVPAIPAGTTNQNLNSTALTPQGPALQFLREAISAVPQPQRTPLIARFLQTKIAHLLKIGESSVSSDVPLRGSGLDSLKAVELKHAVDELLGIEAPLALFLSDRSVMEVAEALAGQTGGSRLETFVEGEPTSSSSSLSSTQLSMWTMQHMEPDSIVYNLHLALRIESDIDAESLRRSFDRLAERHEMLRTVYRSDGDEVIQCVLPPSHLPDFLTAVDATAWSESELQDDMVRRVREPFDLAQGPVLRATLYLQEAANVARMERSGMREIDTAPSQASSLKSQASPHTLLLCAHHIALDLWSVLILVDKLRQIHSEAVRLRQGEGRSSSRVYTGGKQALFPPPASTYAAFVAWQQSYLQSPASNADWDYWRQQLAGELPILALPTDRPRPAVSDYRGASVAVRLSRDETRRLRYLAGRSGVTLFTLLLAAYKVLLHRYTHQTDLIVGIPTAGRSQARFASVVGNFVNPVPLRSHPSGDQPFSVYLAEVHDAVLGALEHQDYPFALMVDALHVQRNADYWPVYQTLFVLQQAQAGIGSELAQFALGEDGEPLILNDWQVRPLGIWQRVENFELKLMAAECRGGLQFSFQYRGDLFDAGTIANCAEQYRRLLAGIVARPDARLSNLPLLSAADLNRLTVEWNATETEYAGASCIHRLFEEQVERTPDAIALVYEDRQLSYRELNGQADRLAHGLMRRGVGPDTPVGICVERSIEMVIGMLGVLKAGGAYLPLDPDHPKERLEAMLEDARAGWILVQPGFEDCFPAFSGEILRLDDEFSWLPESAEHNPDLSVAGESLAYVLFTSGSSGRPKGVGIPHAGVHNRLLWMQQRFGLDGSDVVLQKTPYSFDVSVWEFFWPLLVGARLVMLEPGAHKEPERLAVAIRRHDITTVHFVPSMLGAFLDAVDIGLCHSLRRVICSGEALSPELQQRFFERSGAELHNLYGPTEASIDVTAWACDRERAKSAVPIGRPIANTQVYLLDACLNPVPIGVPGELYIGGVQLARGYLNRLDLTAERFVPNPFGETGDRLYRTGDLARFRSDGAIEYLGRIDQQVKIRGFRIELGEIEAKLREHASIREAAVIVREDHPGDRRLVAYLVSGSAQGIDTESLREFLGRALPDYMIPAAFVLLDKLPVTPNGKLDRKALPAPDIRQQFAHRYVAPRSRIEAFLSELWAEVLRLERVGIHDNFFALGGDSILSIQVASRAHRAGWSIAPRLLFQYQTVAELAAAIENVPSEPGDAEFEPDRTSSEAEAYVPFSLAELTRQEIDELWSRHADIEDLYPLSPMQEGMLFHTLASPGSGIYVMQDRYEIHGPIDLPAFQQAWQAVVDRNPILRTSFVWNVSTRPHQIVHRNVVLPFECLDWSGDDEAERSGRLDSLLRAEQEQGFDLACAPLFRIRIIKYGNDRFLCIRSYHHILMDEWCTSPMFLEFREYYGALSRGLPLPDRRSPPFRDYIAWLEHQDGEKAESFWRRCLDGFSEPTPLVGERAPGVAARADDAVDDVSVELSEADTRQLNTLVQRCRLTANTFVQGAVALLLGRYGGRREVVFGVTVSGRPSTLAGVETILGLFINALPLRVELRAEQPLLEWLRELLARNLESRQYEHTSLVRIQSWSAIPRSDGELFRHLLTYENAPIDPSLLSDKNVLDMRFAGNRVHTNYPITFVAIPGERLNLKITYRRARFELEAAGRMLGHLQTLLEDMIRHPEKRVGELAMLTGPERRQVLADWNRTLRAHPEPTDFVARFEQQVERTPDAAAVACQDERLTYRQLNERVNRLAHALAARGVGPDVIVALLNDRGIDFAIMMLAVFKAGGAYLPLDPGHPDERLAQLLEESGVGLVLAGASYSKRVRAFYVSGLQPAPEVARSSRGPKPAPPILVSDELESRERRSHNPPRRHAPRNLAYVISTSGSTGMPKGAMVEHRGMFNNLITKVPTLGLTEADVIAQTAGQCFDISVWQHLTALVCGARTEIFPEAVARDPDRLLARLAECGVTILEAVPSMIHALLDVAAACDLPHLRWLIPSGEACPTDLCRRWTERFPEARLLNAYGPAECSDDVSYYKVPERPGETETVVPVGHPVHNTRLYVLDHWFEPAPIGVPGEICVAGIQVGRGYLHRPDLTAEKCLPDPFDESGGRLYRTGDLGRYRSDGVVEFLGRLDHQLKIRGFRIEPGEIEAQLLASSKVEQAVVMACEDSRGDKRLVAYVVCGEAAVDNDADLMEELRADLSSRLPNYMVPAAFIRLDAMPLSANGKIDRKSLPVPNITAQREDRYVAPRNPAEEILAGIWKEVLGVERVGVEDNFFGLGGHSLLAVQVLSRVRSIFGAEIPLRALFEATSIERLAEAIEDILIEQLETMPEEEARALLESHG